MQDNETNGCGAKGSFIKPPLAIFFVSSCNKHDLSYNEGGTEYKRFHSDIGFLRAMLSDCFYIKNNFKRSYYIFWAFFYYLAVRKFGHKHFNYN